MCIISDHPCAYLILCFCRDPYKVPITDFFGSVRSVQLTQTILELPEPGEELAVEGHCDSQSCEAAVSEKPKLLYTYVNPLPILDEVAASSTNS